MSFWMFWKEFLMILFCFSHYRDGSMDYGNGGISEVSVFF